MAEADANGRARAMHAVVNESTNILMKLDSSSQPRQIKQ
jgi:hypothetical protein